MKAHYFNIGIHRKRTNRKAPIQNNRAVTIQLAVTQVMRNNGPSLLQQALINTRQLT
jgi:hypothetical protein